MASTNNNDGPLLTASEATNALQAISDKHHLGLKFQNGIGATSIAPLPASAASAFEDFNNPRPAELFGSGRFERLSAAELSLPKDTGAKEYLVSQITRLDLEKFEHNVPAIKLFMDGKYNEVKHKLAELNPPPLITGVDLKVALQASPDFKLGSKPNHLEAQLTPDQFKHLERVMAQGAKSNPPLTPEDILGGSKVKLDHEKHRLIITDGMTAAEVGQYNGNAAVLDAALKTGNIAIVKSVKQSLAHGHQSSADKPQDERLALLHTPKVATLEGPDPIRRA